jgi:hypothetical protein
VLTDRQIKDIITVLNLEKIKFIQNLNIVVFPKKQDDNFKKNFIEVEKKLKRISPFIDLTIGERAEIEKIKAIEHK